MKNLFILFIVFVFVKEITAQKDMFYVRGASSRTFNNYTLDFMGDDIEYHPKSGFATDIGYQREINDRVATYIGIGHFLSYQYHYNNTNGTETKTTYRFNRLYINPGLHYYIPTKGKLLQKIGFGLGLLYTMPSKLKRLENNFSLGIVNYKSAIGGVIDLLPQVRLNSSNVIIEPHIRYRIQWLNADSYTEGDLSLVNDNFRSNNVSNLEIGLKFTFRKKQKEEE